MLKALRLQSSMHGTIHAYVTQVDHREWYHEMVHSRGLSTYDAYALAVAMHSDCDIFFDNIACTALPPICDS